MSTDVFISSPCQQGWVRSELAMLVMRMTHDSRYPKTKVVLDSGAPVEHLMNQYAAQFLESGATHWVHIDADNPPLRNPLDLIEAGKDVVSLPTPCRPVSKEFGPQFMWNIWGVENEPPDGWVMGRQHEIDELPKYRVIKPSEGFHQVGAVGLGCAVIARRVIAKLTVPFARVFDASGLCVASPDFWFSRKCREAGFELWTNWDYPCQHLKEVDLSEFMLQRTPVA